MPRAKKSFRAILTASGLALAILLPGAAPGQDAQNSPAFKIVKPHPCTNNKGEMVRFVDRGGPRTGLAAGMAGKDAGGKPVVFRSNYAAAPPEFQSFIDRHECAHHQTGDVGRPHPPRNGPRHLMNESIADCVAILRLREEEGYDREGLNSVTAAMRGDMAKIGFPEISIASRIGNIENCFAKSRTSGDIINRILKKRGLLRP